MSLLDVTLSGGVVGKSFRSSSLTTARIVSRSASELITPESIVSSISALMGRSYYLARISNVFSVAATVDENSATVLVGLRTRQAKSSCFTPGKINLSFFSFGIPGVRVTKWQLHFLNEDYDSFVRVLLWSFQ